MINSPLYIATMNALAQGKRQSEIARELGISRQRVWTYVEHARTCGELPTTDQTYLYCVRVRRFLAFIRVTDIAKARELFTFYSADPVHEIGVVQWTAHDEQQLLATAKACYLHDHWYHATPQLLRDVEAMCRSGGIEE